MNTTTRYNLLVLKKMDPRYIIQLCCSLSCSIVCMVRGLRAGATLDVSCMHDGSFTVLKTVNLEHRMVLLGCATVNVYMSVRDTRQGGTRGRGVLTFPRDVHASQLPDLVSENECFRRHHIPRSTVSDGTRMEHVCLERGGVLTMVVASACSRTTLASYSASASAASLRASRDGKCKFPAPPRPTEKI